MELKERLEEEEAALRRKAKRIQAAEEEAEEEVSRQRREAEEERRREEEEEGEAGMLLLLLLLLLLRRRRRRFEGKEEGKDAEEAGRLSSPRYSEREGGCVPLHRSGERGEGGSADGGALNRYCRSCQRSWQEDPS